MAWKAPFPPKPFYGSIRSGEGVLVGDGVLVGPAPPAPNWSPYTPLPRTRMEPIIPPVTFF